MSTITVDNMDEITLSMARFAGVSPSLGIAKCKAMADNQLSKPRRKVKRAVKYSNSKLSRRNVMGVVLGVTFIFAISSTV